MRIQQLVKLFASSVGAMDASARHNESQTLVAILPVTVICIELWLCIRRVFLRQLYEETVTYAESDTTAKSIRKLKKVKTLNLRVGTCHNYYGPIVGHGK